MGELSFYASAESAGKENEHMSPHDVEPEMNQANLTGAEHRHAELHDVDAEADPEAEGSVDLSESDVQELYRRSQLALNSGYTVARGDIYAAGLGGSDGSPAGLVGLCEASLGIKDEPSEESEDGGEEGANESNDAVVAEAAKEGAEDRATIESDDALIDEVANEGDDRADIQSDDAVIDEAASESQSRETSESQSRETSESQSRETSESQSREASESQSREASESQPREASESQPREASESQPSKGPGVGERLEGVVETLDDVIETLPPESTPNDRGEPVVLDKSDDADDTSKDDSPEYESWSKKKLLVEASTRGLDVKGHMHKAEIIATLRAAD